MSFSLTTMQMRSRIKTVTRRMGWKNLRPGEHVLAVEKGMGLKKGEKVKPIYPIAVLSVSFEPVSAITQEEVDREGFHYMNPPEFVRFFCRANGCTPETVITRIEFRELT